MHRDKLWHENSNIWAKIEPVLFSSVSMANAVQHIDSITELIELNKGMHILDLCCGIGRHSLELARRSYKVTAVDRTELYLNKARDKAAEEKLDIEFINEDMRVFCRPGLYDVVLNINTSFGYFEDPNDDLTVLGNIYESLKEGGILLFDMMGKEINARIFQERDWEETDDIILATERKVAGDWDGIDMRWTIIDLKEKQIDRVKMHVRLYSASELRRLLLDTGFCRVDIFGSLKGVPYDEKAKRLIVKAQK